MRSSNKLRLPAVSNIGPSLHPYITGCIRPVQNRPVAKWSFGFGPFAYGLSKLDRLFATGLFWTGRMHPVI